MKNITRASLTLLFVLSTALLPAGARAAEWATLTGRFVVEGKAPASVALNPNKDQEVCAVHKLMDEGLLVDDKGGLANAVIMLKTKNVAVAPQFADTATAKVVLDNKNCRFEPHVVVLRGTQTLEIKNSDPVGHNTNISPQQNPGTNPVLPAGGEPVLFKIATEEALPIKVGCNIHPWMGAWVVARKDPYAAVSDSSGKFTIADLPAGSELEFALWAERGGNLKDAKFSTGKSDSKGRFKIKLKPGENDLGDIKVSGTLFK